MSDIISITNRKLCREDFAVCIEKIAAAHPKAIILREKDLTAREYKNLAAEVIGICENLAAIDEEIEKHSSGWRVERISGVSLSILRLAAYEMLYCDPKLPYSIAINEAVELAKQYAEDGAASFINGLLNSLAKANKCEA